ncbi:MAG: alanine racemase [Acidimicrobiales bacterium]|nr:alanine racemase [Acidimicrobiales bacterium]
MTASVATVDLAAIAANVRTLDTLAGDARTCVVVKADGYGHGSVPVASAALEAGAPWLAVANVTEGRVLRAAGIAAPVLVLSEPAPDEIDGAIAAALHLVVYRQEMIDAVARRTDALRVPALPIHLKVDTGMRRVGCEPGDALDLARAIVDAPGMVLEGTMTHLARADEPGDPTTDSQLDVFDDVIAGIRAAGIDPGLRHAANSAATIVHPRARLDLVRVGIATYGIPPAPALAGVADLCPALRWTAPVRLVKRVEAGQRVSYGHRHTFPADTTVATVPAGYADGVRRRLGLVGGAVLIGGRRCPIVGVVTMDQFMVDCGPDANVAVGDEAVLVGSQGQEEITADDVAGLLDTIGYEVVCDISPRVRRRYV